MLSEWKKMTVAACVSVIFVLLLGFGARASESQELHRGEVEKVIHSGGYTYLNYSEQGASRWVAFMEDQRVREGDVVECMKSPPLRNFISKSLGMTFNELEFAPGVRIYRNGALLESEPVRSHKPEMEMAAPEVVE
jgi:hypothetical protein